MQLRATLKYSEPLVRRAVLSYWRRSLGWGILGAVAFTNAMFIWRIVEGDRSWFVGLLAAFGLFGIVMPVAVYLAHYRNSLGKFREMKNPEATFVADEASFTLTSDVGSSTLRWSSIVEVWRFDTFWLLLFSKAQFATVPLQDVPEQMLSYILERVRGAGGKIAV